MSFPCRSLLQLPLILHPGTSPQLLTQVNWTLGSVLGSVWALLSYKNIENPECALFTIYFRVLVSDLSQTWCESQVICVGNTMSPADLS